MPEDQIFKSVIFDNFVPFIGLEFPQGEIKAIIINITRFGKELETKRPKTKVIKKFYYVLEKGFSSINQPGSGLPIDVISLIFIRRQFQLRFIFYSGVIKHATTTT